MGERTFCKGVVLLTKKGKSKARAFCEAYVETMDIHKAAKAAGLDFGEALALLEREETTETLDEVRQSLSRLIAADDAVRRLGALAFGRANDCVKLVLEEFPSIDGLDLSLLSELKRGSNGVIEIKLINRVEALDKLLELLSGTSDEAASFFKALDEAGELE